MELSKLNPTVIVEDASDPSSRLIDKPIDSKLLEGRLTGPLIFATCAAACGSSFIFGYNIGVPNTPADVLKEWISNDSYPALHGGKYLLDEAKDVENATLTQIWAWTVGLFAFGGIFGGLSCGWMADRFGRKGAMMLNNIIAFIAAALMSFAKLTTAYPVLMLGRLIIGVNCGLNSGLAPMYLTEIAPVNYRGMLGSVNQLMVTVSIFVAQVLGMSQVLGTKNLWPILFAFIVVPAIWQLIALPFCPETPNYLLVIKNQPEEAEKSLKRLRQKEDVGLELKAIQLEADKIAKAPKVRFVDMFKMPILRWALIIAVVMMLAQQLSGINAVMFYSSEIFVKNAKLLKQDAIYATLGVGAINIIMTIISTVLVDRLGRRLLMLIGMGGMWVTTILLIIVLNVLQKEENNKGASYSAVAFVYLFVIFFATGPGSIPWFFVSELFNQGAKGHANSVAVMTNWFCAFIVGLSFPPLQKAAGPWSFLLFTICLTIFWLFTFFLVPETKGIKDYAVIERELARKAPGYNTVKTLRYIRVF